MRAIRSLGGFAVLLGLWLAVTGTTAVPQDRSPDEAALSKRTSQTLAGLATEWLKVAERHAAAGRLDEAQEALEVAQALIRLQDRLGGAAAAAPPAPRRGIAGGAAGWYGGRGGHRNLRAGGGGAATQAAVARALEWLANHQDPDGYWDCDGFMKQCRLNPCDGAGYALYDPGVSGLALLAFLGAGETHRDGPHHDTLKAGLRYLKQIQDGEGCFGPRTTAHFTYNHAICTQAMVEAYALTKSPFFLESAQQGVDFIHRCQNPYLGWRYGVRPQDNDTSVTAWMATALHDAKEAGLRVDASGIDGALNWVEKVTEPEYGRVGYTARGTVPARPSDLMEKFPSDKSESLTAAGIWIRVIAGQDPRKSEAIRKGVSLCEKSLPEWDEQSGTIDMYYWHWGTVALFQVGGDAWKHWNPALKAAYLDHQRGEGDEKGSWDPVGPWGRDGGRVYSTALGALALEAYYRFARAR